MKGGLAASIIAVEALIDSGLPLPGALEISGTVDEESGGYGGVAYLAERGWFSTPRVDHVIIPDAGAGLFPENDLVAQNRLYTTISRATRTITLLANGSFTPLLDFAN